MTICRGRPFTNRFGKEIRPLYPDFEVTFCPRILAYETRAGYGVWYAAD